MNKNPDRISGVEPFTLSNLKVITIAPPGPHSLEVLIKQFPDAFSHTCPMHYRVAEGWEIKGAWLLGSENICLEIPQKDGPSLWFYPISVNRTNGGEGLLYFVGDRWYASDPMPREYRRFDPRFLFHTTAPYATFIAVDTFHKESGGRAVEVIGDWPHGEYTFNIGPWIILLFTGLFGKRILDMVPN
jgi:hypothetical protein